MADNSLTKKQQAIFDFIREKIENRGYPPTIREIGNAFDIHSPNGVMCHLKALEKKGHIVRDGGSARAIQIPNVRFNPANATTPALVPMLGLVAAGPALEAVPQQNEFIDLAAMFVRPDYYGLRIRGNSMIEDHIEDGDIVIIRKQNTAENGSRIVAMIDGNVTLKIYHKKRDHIVLEPANGQLAPIIVDPSQDFRILGLLIGVIRKC